MTLLAVAAGIADHPGVACSRIPRPVAVGKLALAGDGHPMAGNHCCCPVKAGCSANGYGQTSRKPGYLVGHPHDPGT